MATTTGTTTGARSAYPRMNAVAMRDPEGNEFDIN